MLVARFPLCACSMNTKVFSASWRMSLHKHMACPARLRTPATSKTSIEDAAEPGRMESLQCSLLQWGVLYMMCVERNASNIRVQGAQGTQMLLPLQSQ